MQSSHASRSNQFTMANEQVLIIHSESRSPSIKHYKTYGSKLPWSVSAAIISKLSHSCYICLCTSFNYQQIRVIEVCTFNRIVCVTVIIIIV